MGLTGTGKGIKKKNCEKKSPQDKTSKGAKTFETSGSQQQQRGGEGGDQKVEKKRMPGAKGCTVYDDGSLGKKRKRTM